MENEIKMFEMFDDEAQEKRRREIKNYNMLHEVEEKERILNQRKENLAKIRKIKVYTGLTILLTASVISLKKYSDYVQKPINLVTHDIMANEGFELTDNGKQVEPKKFDLNDEDKLYEYIKNKDISTEELIESIRSYANKKGFNENIVLGKVKEDYPELFSATEIHKTR